METCSEDTLFSILSFLGDYKEILRVSSRVCKRWNSVLSNYKNLLSEDEFKSVINTPPTLRELWLLYSQGNIITLRSKKDSIIVNSNTREVMYYKERVAEKRLFSDIPSLLDSEVYHVDSHNRKIVYTRRTGREYTCCLRSVIHSAIIDSPVIPNLMCIFQYKKDKNSNGWLSLNLSNPRTEAITRHFSEDINSMNIEMRVIGTDYRQTITIDPAEGNVVHKTCYLNIGTSIVTIEITVFLF